MGKGAVNSLLDELKMPVIWISNIHAREMAESVRQWFDFQSSIFRHEGIVPGALKIED